MRVATWNVNSIRSRLERLLRWLDKVQPDVLCLQELKATDGRFEPSTPLILCGDLNVTRDDSDVAAPEKWAGSVLCHQEARESLEQILGWGLTDVFRQHHPEGGLYSWWDYRMLAFPKNDGLRIDHVFATEPLAKRCTSAEIERDERKGQKPSDHAPVIATFD